MSRRRHSRLCASLQVECCNTPIPVCCNRPGDDGACCCQPEPGCCGSPVPIGPCDCGARPKRPPPVLCEHCGRVARKYFWRDATGREHGFCCYHSDADLRSVYDERAWPAECST